MSEAFEPVGAKIGYTGRIIRAGVERFRFADGEVVSREKVWHPGAVGVVPIDETTCGCPANRGNRPVSPLPGSSGREARRPREAPLHTAQRRVRGGDRQIRACVGGDLCLLSEPGVQRRTRVAIPRPFSPSSNIVLLSPPPQKLGDSQPSPTPNRRFFWCPRSPVFEATALARRHTLFVIESPRRDPQGIGAGRAGERRLSDRRSSRR